MREEVGRDNDNFPDDNGSDIGPVTPLTLDDEIVEALAFTFEFTKDSDGVVKEVIVT